MLYSSVLLALVAAVSATGPGGSVISKVSPDSKAPSGCMSTFEGGEGTFTFNTGNLTKRDAIPEFEMEKRQQTVLCGDSLTLTLSGGKLLDAKGRTGYIAANRQFQFDGPPQAGAIYTAGWSFCGFNNSLALGGNFIFYNCLSGSFSNIYDESRGGQCYPVTIDLIPCQGKGATAASSYATIMPTSMSSSSSSEDMMSEMMTSVTSMPTMASSMMAGTPSAAPPPMSNTTMPVGTGTAVAPTTTGKSPSPSPFTGAGAVATAAQKMVGLVAGAAALAMF